MFNKKEGLTFLLSAPAGAGKTTLVNKLLKEHPNIRKAVSYTTRKPREDEVDGRDYHFLTEKEFFSRREDFLESITILGNHYATSKKDLEENQKKSMHTIFVIDTRGALVLLKKIPATSIFLLPPSYEELENRLQKRNTETEEGIQARMENAKKELEMLRFYDYYIINDVLESSYIILKSIIFAEEHRVKHLRI